MDYLKQWMKKLITDILIFVAVCIFMLIFMKIFYPDALSVLFLSGQFSVEFISALKLWPLVILALLIYSMHRRRKGK